ncbi:MAG: hypothetical protein Q9159_000423 [Coniocarpon cinnabarinum]
MSSEEPEERSDASDAEPTEWLAAGRSRRSNAGNRMQAMLSTEETQDEHADEEEAQLNAVFMEDEEEPDEEFEDKDEGEDDEGGDSSSSSEDEDHAQDELAGEKQLQKEERDKQKSLKRKADNKFIKPRAPAKRVRIDEHGQPRPVEEKKTPERSKKKRTERSSWTLDEGNKNLRESSRTLSVQNKERTRENLKENEAKRTKQLASLEAAREKRQAESKGPMSQEDRLREAAEVERQNAKSLNRWQELEEERLKRQKQKIEALQSRKIDGPMIRWWSGPATWVGDKLVRVGRPKPIQEIEEPVKDETPKQVEIGQQEALAPSSEPSRPATPYASSAAHTQQIPSKITTTFLDGIEQFAAQTEQPLSEPKPPSQQVQHSSLPLLPPVSGQSPFNLLPPQTPLQQFLTGSMQQSTAPAVPTASMIPQLPPSPPPPPITALRSMLSFENFDPVLTRSTEAQRRVVFGLKTYDEGNALKQPIPELCAVTAQRARYRDPLTGMPYRGMAELKRLRRLPGLSSDVSEVNKNNKARWSGILDAWIGTKNTAKNVPDSFFTGVAPVVAPVEPKAVVEDANIKNEEEAAPAA